MDSLVIVLVVLAGITGFLFGMIVSNHFNFKRLKRLEKRVSDIQNEPDHIIEIRDNRPAEAVDPFKPW